MARAVRVNPEVLKWAREERSLTISTAASLIGIEPAELEALERGDKLPNLGLFRKMADRYRMQYAALAMPAPLPPRPKPKDFRTFEGRTPETSLLTMVAFEEALNAQETVADFIEDDAGLYAPPKLRKASIDDDVVALATRERNELGITDEEQLKWRDTREAYNKIRASLEALGIFTFEKEMPTEDCRGFSVYGESRVPIIVVNKDEGTPQAKTFTLLHEYAHLLLRDSGICDENRRSKNAVERFCNQFATNFLMPSKLVSRIAAPLLAQNDGKASLQTVKDAARRLRVSQQSMALRFEELKFAPRGFYDAWRREIEDADLPAPRKSDKPVIVGWERRKLSELGRRYSRLVLNAMQSGVVTRPEGFSILGRGMSSGVFSKFRQLLR